MTDEILGTSDEVLCVTDEILCATDELLCVSDEILCVSDEVLCVTDEVLCVTDGVLGTSAQQLCPHAQVERAHDEGVGSQDEVLGVSGDGVGVGSKSEEAVAQVRWRRCRGAGRFSRHEGTPAGRFLPLPPSFRAMGRSLAPAAETQRPRALDGGHLTSGSARIAEPGSDGFRRKAEQHVVQAVGAEGAEPLHERGALLGG